MSQHVVTIASRKSPLAMWQSEFVQQELRTRHPELIVDIHGMLTQGDKQLATPLYNIGGKALFVKELEKAILERRADLAVHSIKDMPVELPDGLALVTICKREDPRDALVSNHYERIDELPEGAIVGTSSLRRQSQLMAMRPDIRVKALRGNVGTRLSKLDEGHYDAIILAAAGLKRLELESRIRYYFSIDEMIPGVGQGAVGIEARKGDQSLRELLSPLNHQETLVCVTAERLITEALGGSCQVPLAAHAIIKDDTISVSAMVGKIDGSKMLTAKQSGPVEQHLQVARGVAEDLLDQGAREIIALYER